MIMSTTFVVDAGMVGCLRIGLHSVLGQAAEAICEVVEGGGREHRRESYAEPLDRFDRARALLGVVGWEEGETATARARDVEIDLRAHRDALLAALRLQVEAERGYAESLPKQERPAVEDRIGALCGLIERVQAWGEAEA
jgi:hypothetical protein